MNKAATTLYQQVAEDIAADIEQGVYLAEQKIPSVRKLSKQLQVSISTINQAYALLEDQGLIQAKPQAGYFVRKDANEELPAPPVSQGSKPTVVTKVGLISNVLESASKPGLIKLGAAIPDIDFLPFRSMQTHVQKAVRFQGQGALNYQFAPGLESLRIQIAKRMRTSNVRCHPDDIIITNGATEAIFLGLNCCTEPGDIIAVESPCYYGYLQMAQRLGLKVIEIPTDPTEGIGLDALTLALSQWPIKILALTSRYSNPSGAVVATEKQKQIMELVRQYPELTVIEDDIYGELGFTDRYETVLKSFDITNQVMHCSSYSKTVAPGLHIGWCIPGRNYQKFKEGQMFSTLSASALSQYAMSSYLEQGHHDKHLRKMIQSFKENVERLATLIRLQFPEGTKLSVPEGGFILWLCLPEGIKATELQRRASEENISIVPGEIFSNTDQFKNYIRLNCAVTWNEDLKRAVIRLAELTKEMM